MKALLIAPLLMTLAFAPIAAAQEQAKSAQARFQAFDSDKDGALTREELAAGLQARAEKAGKVFKPRAVDRLFTGDADQDGRLTAAEFEEASAKAHRKAAAPEN